MIQSSEDYPEPAEAARAAAAGQGLDNVRRKHSTDAATWDALALRKRKIDALRLRRLPKREHFSIVRAERDGG